MMLTAVAPDVMAAERSFFNELIGGSVADSFSAEDSTLLTDACLDELFAPSLTFERVNSLVQAKALAWLELNKVPGSDRLEDDAFKLIASVYDLIQFRFSGGSGRLALDISMTVLRLAECNISTGNDTWLRMFGNVFGVLIYLVALPEVMSFNEDEKFYREHQIRASIVWRELGLGNLVVDDA